MKNKYLPKITLKIFKNEEMIVNTTSHKRRRIYSILQEDKFKNCTFYIEVQYDRKGKYKNETGDNANQKQAILAYKAFINQNLIDEFSN